MNKILVDTNIFIYALNKDSKYYKKSAQFLIDTNNLLFTTSKNISEFFAVTSKLKVDYSLAYQFYIDIKENTTILFPNDSSLALFDMFIEKYKPIGNQVYDLEIASIMISNHIYRIATYNTKDFESVNEVLVIAP